MDPLSKHGGAAPPALGIDTPDHYCLISGN